MQNRNTKENFNLFEGKLTTLDIRELVHSQYEKSINYYKIEKIKIWVGNHDANTTYHDELINLLSKQKENALNNIDTAKISDCNIEINLITP